MNTLNFELEKMNYLHELIKNNQINDLKKEIEKTDINLNMEDKIGKNDSSSRLF